jgi:hypothetical protein
MQVKCFVSLAHFRSILVQQQSNVTKSRWRPPEGIIQTEMLRRRDLPFHSPKDMRHLHMIVVHDVGEMICRQAIRLHEDEIVVHALCRRSLSRRL